MQDTNSRSDIIDVFLTGASRMNVSCNGFLGSKCTCPSCPSRLIPDCGLLGVQKVCTSYVWGRTLTSTAIESKPSTSPEHEDMQTPHSRCLPSRILDWQPNSDMSKESIFQATQTPEPGSRAERRPEVQVTIQRAGLLTSAGCCWLLLLCVSVCYTP